MPPWVIAVGSSCPRSCATVKDGGRVQVRHPNGKQGVTLGPLLDDFATNPGAQANQIGAQMEMRREDGESGQHGPAKPELSAEFGNERRTDREGDQGQGRDESDKTV